MVDVYATAEKFLMQIYERNIEICARICVASADKDAGYLYHALDEVENFIVKLKKELKNEQASTADKSRD